MTTIDIDTLNGEDIIDVRDIIERYEELESEIPEELCQRDPEQVAEKNKLDELLSELAGNGGDEQWRGDWYPVTLIRESYFTDYARDLVLDCYDLKGLPTFVHIDWEATAREVKVDYSEVEIDGVTYFYR